MQIQKQDTAHLTSGRLRERRRCSARSKLRYQAGNQNSTTYTLSTPVCDWQPALCYQQAKAPVTPRLLLSPFLHMTSCSASIMSEAECSVEGEREKKTPTLCPAAYSVVIFKCQMVKHITVKLKHVEQNGFGGFQSLIQQLSQRFSDVR